MIVLLKIRDGHEKDLVHYVVALYDQCILNGDHHGDKITKTNGGTAVCICM